MNRHAYLTTGLAIKTLSNLTRARIHHYDEDHLPKGPVIYVINHFTRIETLFMPELLYRLTRVPIWSLADQGLYSKGLATFLDQVGAVSTRNPDRDRLIVKSLLTGEASWIIYPEGRMVKSKKIVEKGRYMVAYAGGKHPPHTGAATLALRTEFYRQRLQMMSENQPGQVPEMLAQFGIEDLGPVLQASVHIVPVNITYYPIRARENVISRLASKLKNDLPERFIDELMTEGSMLLSGVDVDIRFGEAIDITPYLTHRKIRRDIGCPDSFGFDHPISCRPVMRKMALKIMQRYMSAIYHMTRVNHDHLFASMMRLMPGKRIEPMDLRRRVYTAACLDMEKMGIYTHGSLASDQIHLIADDRFGKYDAFKTLAHDHGIYHSAQDRFVKNKDTFSGALDFHNARIKNPLAVIANEVEPLSDLIRRIRRIAWTPSCVIRRRLANRLMAMDINQYRQDYHQHYSEQESKDIQVGSPYLLRGRDRELGVVLVHGYMAAPLEVRELAEYLWNNGYWVYAPRLAGHGTTPEDLARTRYQQWVESVDRGYAIIQSCCRRTVVGGFSNGAGLALDLAARIDSISGVFAISPPMRLQDFSSHLVPAVDIWNRFMEKVGVDGARKTFVDNHPENPHINYHRNPIAGVRELERLMDRVADRLGDIRMPALVVQAQGDPVVNPQGSKTVFKKLGSDDKTYVLMNMKRHGIVRGEGADRVHRLVGDFIRRL